MSNKGCAICCRPVTRAMDDELCGACSELFNDDPRSEYLAPALTPSTAMDEGARRLLIRDLAFKLFPGPLRLHGSG